MSVETIHTGCAFQGREYVVESFEVVQLWFFEVFFEVRVAVGACVPGAENMRVSGLPRLRMELTSAHMATGFQSVVW